MNTRLTFATVLITALLWGAVARAAVMVYDHRENVNLLNADNAVLTALQTSGIGIPVSGLRANYSDTYWDGGPNPPGGTNSIAIDFGESRNLERIRLLQYAGSEATAITVETSNDGIAWTPQAYGTSVTGQQTDLLLASPVDAQRLRLTATAINDTNGTDRWIVPSLRVFGSAGTLANTTKHLDLVSRTGFDAAQSLTLSGISITTVTPAQYIDDALNPIARQVLYNVESGSSFLLDLGQPFVLETLALYHANNPNGNQPNVPFHVDTSVDGISYATVYSATTFPMGLNYYPLTPSLGQYLRFTLDVYPDIPGGAYITDIQVFGGGVPEPSVAGLLLLGALLSWRRTSSGGRRASLR